MFKENLVKSAFNLAKYFKVDVRVSLFGVEILHFEFPPSEKADSLKCIEEPVTND